MRIPAPWQSGMVAQGAPSRPPRTPDRVQRGRQKAAQIGRDLAALAARRPGASAATRRRLDAAVAFQQARQRWLAEADALSVEDLRARVEALQRGLGPERIAALRNGDRERLAALSSAETEELARYALLSYVLGDD